MPEKIGLEAVLDNRDFNRAVKQYLSGIDRMEGKTRRSGGILSKALGGIGKVAAGALAIGVAAGAAAVGAVGLAIAKAIPLAADFQGQLVGLQLAARESGMSFDELHDVSLTVGGDQRLLGVSATGAAEALTGLYKAGLSTTEIFGDVNAYMEDGAELGGALRASIDLAAATELDMVQASDLAAIALATFGGEMETEAERADFVTKAMDTLVRAADASVAEVADLSAGLKNAGPVMASYGYSIEDTSNALAILSTRGITGAEAGTALRSMMTNILRPTDKVTGALEELNISLYDQEGHLKPLNTIIGEFQTSLAGVTDEQRNQYVTTLAGTYGMRAMNTLLDEGTEGWSAMEKATAAATGIQAQAEARSKTFAGRMEALQGTVETLKIGIGEAFLPVLTDLMGRFSEMVSEHGPQLAEMFGNLGAWLGENLPRMIEKAVEVGGKIVAWMRDDLPRAISVVTGFWNEQLKPFIEGLRAGIGDAQRDWSVAWGKIEEIVRSVVERVGPFVKEIGASAVAFIRAVVRQVKTWLDANREDIKLTLQSIKQIWEAVWPHLERVLRSVWETIKITITTSIKIIQGVIEAVMAVIRGDWDMAWESIKGVFTTVWDAMRKILKAKINLILGFFGTDLAGVGAAISKWASDTWATITDWATETWATITDWASDVQEAVQKGMDYLKSFIPNTLASIQETWNRVWGNIRDFVATTWANIKSTIYDAMDSLFAEMGLDLGEMLATWGQIWDDVKLIAETVWNRIYEAVTGKVEEVRADVETEITALQTAWNMIWDAVSTKATEIWTAIYDWISEKVEALRAYVEEEIQALKDFWGPIWDDISAKASEIWDAIYTAASTKVQEVWQVVTSKIQEIHDWIRSKISDFVSVGRALIDGLKDGVKKAAGRLISAATGVISDAIGAAKRLLGIPAGSLSAVFVEIGRSIADGLIAGILESAADVQEALVGLFDVGAALRGLGAAAAQRMRERIIDPAKARLEEIEELLADPGTQRDWVWLMDLLQERLRLTEEIAENEARMAALRVQEQDIGFLQQQASLLELIREYGLDAAEILGGMTLGVEANVADVVDAMTKAMQKVVRAAQAELGISSPSKVVAAKVGAPIMQGVVLGIEQYGGVLAEAFSRALVAAPAWGGPMVGAPAMIPAAAGATVNLNMDTTINDRMDAAVFEARVRQIITSSV